ncbi:glyoxalase/bleomycin resistance protein/dioxygenase [Nitzschia inconspicua]|uniref:Glyoxalase/bleomycin resistance protein/dioxygenase n=1 Tax=Nitzschia inconspicua TaxID=303405 RepID=A0A9K3KQQ1_9STRA|nr:glyoxalase/bleomycin resistance protein/dioxygenase [Nitzschia inconspicua]
MLQIKLVSLLVNDQAKALAFYTSKLGFVKKTEIDLGGGGLKWISIASPGQDDNGVQISLEPSTHFDFVTTYQKEIYQNNIPATAFAVDDIEQEYELLKGKGVEFRSEPSTMPDGTKLAILDDTVGNWIQIYQIQSKTEDTSGD